MKTFEKTCAQGDVYIERIDTLPAGTVAVAPENGKLIVTHSESARCLQSSAPARVHARGVPPRRRLIPGPWTTTREAPAQSGAFSLGFSHREHAGAEARTSLPGPPVQNRRMSPHLR